MLKNNDVIRKFFMYCGYEECHNDNILILEDRRQLISFDIIIAEFIRLQRGNVERTFLLINPVHGNKAQEKHITKMYEYIICLGLNYAKASGITIEDSTLLYKTDLYEKGWNIID